MESLPGQSLQAELRCRQLTVTECLTITIEVARLLAALHSQRIVHKDIKPNNILIDLPNHSIYLVDFGIATRLPPESQGTPASESIEGTPQRNFSTVAGGP